MTASPLPTMRRLILAAVLCAAAAAAPAQPIRHHPVQGGIAVLDLGTEEARPQVTYGGSSVMVFRQPDDHWVGVIGIPLKADPGRGLLKINGKFAAFRIAPGEYGESHIEITEKRFVEPPDNQLHQRILREQRQLDRLRSSWRQTPPPKKILLPARGIMSTPYGFRRYINSRLSATHRGLDIAADIGTPVISPAAGIVTMAQNLFYTGLTVVIDHGMGMHSLYAHLSEIATEEGRAVEAGAPIGKIGATGRVTGAHLHWGLTLNGTSVDPALLLSEEQLRQLQPPADAQQPTEPPPSPR